MDIVVAKFVANVKEHLKLEYPVRIKFKPLYWSGDQATIRRAEPYHIIHIADYLCGPVLYSVLAHELRHCYQEEQGMCYYEYKRSRRYIVWGDKKYRCTYDLWDRRDTPWEEDAIKFEVQWYKFVPRVVDVKSNVRRVR